MKYQDDSPPVCYVSTVRELLHKVGMGWIWVKGYSFSSELLSRGSPQPPPPTSHSSLKLVLHVRILALKSHFTQVDLGLGSPEVFKMTPSHHNQQCLPLPSPLPPEPSLARLTQPAPGVSDFGFSSLAGAACAPSAVCGGRLADALPVSAAKAVGLDLADLSSQAGDRRASGAGTLSGNLETPILLAQRGILPIGSMETPKGGLPGRRAPGDGQGPASLHPQAPILPHLPPGFPQATISVQFRFVSRPGSLSFQ